jgi:hypothetical protein
LSAWRGSIPVTVNSALLARVRNRACAIAAGAVKPTAASATGWR